MSLRKLPTVKAFDRPEGMNWDAPSEVLGRWAEMPQAAEADDPNTISIYDVIGEDFWTGEGTTAKRIAAALRRIGPNAVTVNINSPGGDFFEGLAIFNLLLEHPASVDVRVMGMAASAASVIAMAGDSVTMGLGSFLMVHNTWAVAIGNQHDMRESADVLATFDRSLVEIYTARSGQSEKEITAMLDAESWLSAGDAVAKGFADEVADLAPPADGSAAARSEIPAKRRIDAILAQQGMPRSERRSLLRAIATGTHDAAGPVTPRADDIAAGIGRLIETLKS